MKRASRLMTPNLLLLWQGLTISMIGNQAFSIGVIIWLKHTTGSAAAMGLIGMLAGLPSVLLGPLAGACADRWSRRTILIVADLVSGLATACVGFALATGNFGQSAALQMLAAAALILGISEAFYLPAFTAAIPDVVHKDRLNAANSVVQASIQVSMLMGQAASGALFRVLGAPVLFLFDAASFIYSAFCECLTTIPQVKREHRGSRISELKSDTVEGVRYIWRSAGLRRLVLGSSVLNALTVPVILLLPFYVEDTLKLSTDWYGFVIAAYTAGSLAGFSVAGALNLSGPARSRALMVLMAMQGAAPAALSAIRHPVPALVLFFAGGLFVGFVSVSIISIVQAGTASELRGRVFGILATIAGAISPLAMGLFGVLADLLGRNVPLIYFLSGTAMIAVALFLPASASYRQFLASGDAANEPASQTPVATEGVL